VQQFGQQVRARYDGALDVPRETLTNASDPLPLDPPERPVEDALDDQYTTIMSLHARIDALEIRLASVLLHAEPPVFPEGIEEDEPRPRMARVQSIIRG
jgi:hypothetical protein